MRKSIYHFMWVSGIFLLLIIILAMIMIYKIKYESSIYYKYLYFYNCNDKLCSTINEKEISDKSDIYSVYKYQKETPKFVELGNDYIEIVDNNNHILYDYVRGESITSNYKNYKFIDGNELLFVASNKENKYGIINNEGKIFIDFKYDFIKDSYNKNMIVSKLEEKYGIISLESKEMIIDYIYDDIFIYNDVIVLLKDNILKLTDTNKKVLSNDILYENIDNVNIELKDNLLNIKVSNDNEFSEYKFDIVNKKMT